MDGIMTYTTPYRVLSVIASCNTRDQLACAERYAAFFLLRRDDYAPYIWFRWNDLFQRLIREKAAAMKRAA